MSGNDKGSWQRRRPDREEQRRRSGKRERHLRDRAAYDPAPPSEDDYVIGDRSGLQRLSGPEAVGDALDTFLAGTGWHERVKATRLLSDWPALVGEDIAAHCRPVRIKDKELVVEAESHAWATQLNWLESQLRQKVNQAAGEHVIDRIRVTVGGSDVAPGRGGGRPGGPSGGRWG